MYHSFLSTQLFPDLGYCHEMWISARGGDWSEEAWLSFCLLHHAMLCSSQEIPEYFLPSACRWKPSGPRSVQGPEPSGHCVFGEGWQRKCLLPEAMPLPAQKGNRPKKGTVVLILTVFTRTETAGQWWQQSSTSLPHLNHLEAGPCPLFLVEHLKKKTWKTEEQGNLNADATSSMPLFWYYTFKRKISIQMIRNVYK